MRLANVVRNLLRFVFINKIVVPATMLIAAVWPLATGTTNAQIVISEFRTRGPNGVSDEFIEITNISCNPIDVSGWKLKSSSQSGATITTRVTITAGTILAPGQHFLAASNTNYSGTVAPDATFSPGMSDVAGIAVAEFFDGIVDQVGMCSSGEGCFHEGTQLTPLTGDTDQSYERKASGIQDTNNNNSDFQLRTPSDSQNLSSAAGGCLAVKIHAITKLTNGHVQLQCSGIPNQNHQVKATADLVQPFAPLATVAADNAGTFTFEDIDAATFPARFYQLSYP